MERKTLSVPEAATALGIGRSAAYEAARTGDLPTIRVGRRLLVPIVALERWLEGAGMANSVAGSSQRGMRDRGHDR